MGIPTPPFSSISLSPIKSLYLSQGEGERSGSGAEGFGRLR